MDPALVPRAVDAGRARPHERLVLGAVHRRTDGGHARPAHPAVLQADQGIPRHADAAAGPAEAAEEVQGEERPRLPPADAGGDDGPVQVARDQPVLLVSADPGAVADLLRAVPRALLDAADRLGRVPRRSAARADRRPGCGAVPGLDPARRPAV